MKQRNMSDIIESYLKSFVDKESFVEIRRSDIAEQFACVPSQINYVINTRFTQEHGYLVESKRGGGGYIRIEKVTFIDDVGIIEELVKLVGDSMTTNQLNTMIKRLLHHKIISQREAMLIVSTLDSEILTNICENENIARAMLFKNFLYQLKYSY